MCTDYRFVNKMIVADKFPLPRIDEILDGLGWPRYFSILDLFQVFHQISLDEESRDPQCFFFNSYSRELSLYFPSKLSGVI